MRTIAHISDLHFGREDKLVQEALLADLHRLQPSLVVVSGDLTQRALVRQFARARAFLKCIEQPLLVIPGNHDIPFFDITRRFLLPLHRYKHFIDSDTNPVFRDSELSVLGINTVRSLAVQNGRISRKQLALLQETVGEFPSDTLRIVVTHHAFIRPPEAQRKKTVGGAAQALNTMEQLGIDLVLAGHFHRSLSCDAREHYPELRHQMIIVQAGTAISKRLKNESNAYNLITVTDKTIIVGVRGWNGKVFREVEKKSYDRPRKFHVKPEKGWETIVDFTDGGRTEGVPAEEVMKMLRKIQRGS